MSIVLKGQGWIPERGLVCESLCNSRASEESEPEYRLVQVVGYDSVWERVQFIPMDGPFKGKLCQFSQMKDQYGDMQFRRISQ